MSNIHSCNILIIGAGPAGLAVAGRLSEAGIPFEILEQADKIAPRWHGHYDRLCLHTVKQFSQLPHLPFPDSLPTYVPKKDLIAYYERYSRHFRIQPRFNETVVNLEKTPEGWLASTQNGHQYLARHVVVTTGVNRVPVRPSWPGQAQFKGDILHSIDYKNPSPFNGKKVLVIGMGNTGAEIALDLSEKGVETWISVRSPLVIVPRDVAGRPVQLTGKLLEKLPLQLGDWIGAQVRKIVFGDLRKYGIPVSDAYPAAYLRAGKTPTIDIGTIRQIKAGKIKVVGPVASFSENGVLLHDGGALPIDAVILATGYEPQLAGFIRNLDGCLTTDAHPRGPIGAGACAGLYFVGFDHYQLGGVLGTIQSDSKTVVDELLRRLKIAE